MKKLTLCFLHVFLYCFWLPVIGLGQTSDDLGSLDSLLNVRISSASKYEQTLAEAPASVTIVTREEIQQYGYRDLSELMNQIRDLYIAFDRDYTYLGVRGFSRPTDYNNRLAVMVNGSLINENMWGIAPVGAEFMGFNIDAVERIEFIAGPASTLYGNSPMTGMINIVTVAGNNLDKYQVTMEAGSFGKLQGGFVLGKETASGLKIGASGKLGKTDGQELYYPEYDDSSTNFGIADHRDWSKHGGLQTSLSYKGLTWQGLYSHRTTGLATGSFGVLYNDPRSQNSDRYGMAEMRYEHELNRSLAISVRAYGNYFQNIGQYPYDTSDGGLVLERTLTLYTGAEVRARWDVTESNRLMVGVESIYHLRAKYSQVDEDHVLWAGDFPYLMFGAYVQDEYQVAKWLNITAGGRFDRLNLNRLALTPRLAINIFPSATTVIKLLYGEAFRSPTVYEFYVDDPIYARPNFDLKSERMRNSEVNFQQRIGQIAVVSGSAYFYRMSNLIDQVEDSSDGLIQYQNVGKAQGLGTSIEGNLRLKVGLNAYLRYSFQHSIDGITGEDLTNAPQHMLKTGVTWRFARHFSAAAESNFQTGRLTVQGTMTDPFVVLNANIGYDPGPNSTKIWGRFHLFLRITNILNAKFSYPGGYEHLQAAILQNGRAFNLKLTIDI